MSAATRWSRALATQEAYARDINRAINKFREMYIGAAQDENPHLLAKLICDAEAEVDNFEEPYRSQVKSMIEQAKLRLEGIQ